LTVAIGMKRLGLAIAAVVALGVCALPIMAWLIPAETVREAVKAEIREVTGLNPVLRGEVSVSLFPAGTVTFNDVVLGDTRAGAQALTADRIVARLRFFPLLTGHFEIADVSLVRPTISVIVEPNGRSNWSPQIEALARALKPAAARAASFSEIRISDGTIVIRDEAHKLLEMLTQAELALAWPSISNSFGATGRFSWHGQSVDAALSLGDFVAALSGERSGLKLRLSAVPLKFAYDGYISSRPTLRMEGTLSADSGALREALRWTGQQQLPGGGFGPFSLKAQTNVTGGTIALSNANIELDGNTAEGVLTFATDGRQTLQGTLAANGIDLTPYVSTIRLLTSGERDWNRLPIALDGLNGTDVDLRLSAAKVTLASVKLGRTAVAANLRNGHLTVTVGESQAFGGVIQGSFGLADSHAGADLKAQLQFLGVDLEQALGEMFGIRRLEGNGNLGFTIEASGASIYALAKSMNGTASLTSSNGAITGLNLEQLLRRLERRPLSGGGEFRSGRTAYDNLAVNIKIAEGVATVDDVRVEGPAVRLAMGGVASIPDRDLDLKGTASLLSTGANAAVPGFDLPFVVQGPWDDPLMLPDPESLIRRSGAAAPLLDLLRNRNRP
jgi:AsmA protein